MIVFAILILSLICFVSAVTSLMTLIKYLMPEREPACVKCGYPRRGLERADCPECGVTWHGYIFRDKRWLYIAITAGAVGVASFILLLICNERFTEIMSV